DTDAASTAEARARAELARKKADRDVVAKDESRFVEAHRKRADAAEEDDAADAWQGNRGSK
ncbi:MAG TPA: hypothetical protein VIF62_06425, partial [Labilithrix sp.]